MSLTKTNKTKQKRKPIDFTFTNNNQSIYARVMEY